jgi:hypothetical protein
MTTMPEQYTPNGTKPAASDGMNLDELDELGARIPFGDRANQNMPASWAAGILRILAERDPETFGAYMTEVATGHRVERGARRGRPRGDGAE